MEKQGRGVASRTPPCSRNGLTAHLRSQKFCSAHACSVSAEPGQLSRETCYGDGMRVDNAQSALDVGAVRLQRYARAQRNSRRPCRPVASGGCSVYLWTPGQVVQWHPGRYLPSLPCQLLHQHSRDGFRAVHTAGLSTMIRFKRCDKLQKRTTRTHGACRGQRSRH